MFPASRVTYANSYVNGQNQDKSQNSQSTMAKDIGKKHMDTHKAQ